jgi:hypothetical protein
MEAAADVCKCSFITLLSTALRLDRVIYTNVVRVYRAHTLRA